MQKTIPIGEYAVMRGKTRAEVYELIRLGVLQCLTIDRRHFVMVTQ